MGSFFSIFKSKKKREYHIRKMNSTDFPSAARAWEQQQMGSRQKPIEYWSDALREGPITSNQLEQLYYIPLEHRGGKRTRKHTRNSNSTLKRSTRKQNRA
jgi:hypothetical protein